MHDLQKPPDIDPVLSSGAKKLRKKKLSNVPWSHSGKHPGNAAFWYVILLMIRIAWKYIFRRKQIDSLPDYAGGRILTSTHINGLVDPLVLSYCQDRRVISMGRHDIMTMPLVGWFSRRMGSQPVIRRPEIAGGVADKEYAQLINHRTLLTMTNCIASGHNAVVMPEGKSHQDARLHKLKTGALRFAINASAIAHEKQIPPPALQPVGLHYRCHHWFRTDLFVEFTKPIPVPHPVDLEIGRMLVQGEWVEPPAEQVNTLTSDLFESLSQITPDAPDWETYRGWLLIGHILQDSRDKPLSSYRDEVLAAREVRALASSGQISQEDVDKASQAAQILHSHELDGRHLFQEEKSSLTNWSRFIIGSIIMLATAPISLFSTGIQASIAWYFCDRTDEGVDARTTFHMLAAMFSPVIFWPPIALASSLAILGFSPYVIPLALGMMISFHVCNVLFLFGYDQISDFKVYRKRSRLFRTNDSTNLLKLVSEIRANLNLL